MAIAAEKATALNLGRSLAYWVHGEYGSDYPDSAALVRDDDGTLKRFNQVYSLAPPVIPATAMSDIDIDRRLREKGSPQLVLGQTIPGPLQANYSGDEGYQDWAVGLTGFFAVWRSGAVASFDTMATERQMRNAVEKIGRLLDYNDGFMPVWHFGSGFLPTDMVGYATLFQVGSPVVRTSEFRADWNINLTVVRELL